MTAWQWTSVPLIVPAQASPWAEAGNSRLRHDIEVLTAYGLIDGVITTWPIPWAQISERLTDQPARTLPEHVHESLARVKARLDRETDLGAPQLNAEFAATSKPGLVREFGDTARGEVDTMASFEKMWSATALRINIGYQGDFDTNDVTLDGSYIATTFGNTIFYAGYVDQWWGPGWTSSLILSTNARPLPKIGFMRRNPKPFNLPVLKWLGPWQVNTFVGLFDDDEREIENPLLAGMRLTFNPLPGLELGLSRTLQICGEGRPCGFGTWKDALFGNDNQGGDPNQPSNQLGGFDLRYTRVIADLQFSLTGQLIGEDEANKLPFKFATQFGFSVAGGAPEPFKDWRFIAEFSDTTANGLFDDTEVNVVFDHFIYRTGYRFRGRALGASVDGDSRVLTIGGTATDRNDRTYNVRYHYAEINRDGTCRQDRFRTCTHTISATAENINIVEFGVTTPSPYGLIDVEVRLQDDQPNTPERKDFDGAVEFRWRTGF